MFTQKLRKFAKLAANVFLGKTRFSIKLLKKSFTIKNIILNYTKLV